MRKSFSCIFLKGHNASNVMGIHNGLAQHDKNAAHQAEPGMFAHTRFVGRLRVNALRIRTVPVCAGLAVLEEEDQDDQLARHASGAIHAFSVAHFSAAAGKRPPYLTLRRGSAIHGSTASRQRR